MKFREHPDLVGAIEITAQNAGEKAGIKVILRLAEQYGSAPCVVHQQTGLHVVSFLFGDPNAVKMAISEIMQIHMAHGGKLTVKKNAGDDITISPIKPPMDPNQN